MSSPVYLQPSSRQALAERVHQLRRELSCCRLCPRSCGVDRIKGETGFCRVGREAVVASFGPHFGEESPLVGTHGSGTIFFSSCNLLCSFCQNHDISHGMSGSPVSARELADIMLHLARSGCHNINLVTPSHVVPQILESLLLAVDQGLRLPLVFNTGSYDRVETLRLLEGIVDIYMPDLKFWDERRGARHCGVHDYREVATAAIREMHRQTGDLVIEGGLATRGLLVRHLVMPDGGDDLRPVMEFIAALSPHTYVNVMDQYHPCFRAADDPLINRRITPQEFSRAVQAAEDAGLHRLHRR